MVDLAPRVQALHRLSILDTAPESDFDQITEMAASLFRVPIALITFVDHDRYFFKSAVGAAQGSAPLEPGFCSSTIESTQVRVVHDASLNPETQNHSMVCSAPNLKFYAGAPLITAEGFAVGTLCLMDTEPRSFSKFEVETLEALAKMVVYQLDRRLRALDSDDRNQLQLRDQKRQSLVKMTSGIAHDFNNYLMAIQGNMELLEDYLKNKASGKTLLKNSRLAAARAIEMAHQLLTFAGERSPSKQTVALYDIVTSVAELMKTGLPEGIDIQERYDAAGAQINADPGQLRQALINLVMNAAESYKAQRGLVEIAVIKTDGQVTITVADQGCGVNLGIEQDIFDPFFSTKTPSRGMGLAITQRIISDHGGTVNVESNAEGGTRSTITLPCLPETLTLGTPGRGTLQESSLAGRRLLIIDDEPDVRRFLTAAAKHLGCEVTELSDGLQAVDIITNKRLAPEVVLVDTSMPSISGDATLKLLHEQIPDLPAVVMSGHDLNQVKQRFDGLRVMDFLQKPFSISQLEESLRKALLPPTS